MSTYLPALRQGLSFGDLCEADFLYDVHVREDARSMRRETSSVGYAQKKWHLPDAVHIFLPALEPRAGETFALAHGTYARALVLSDDCLIATVLGREAGKPTNRRLLMAPVVDASAEEVADLADRSYGRFPLPADAQFAADGVVDLRRCFMADARDVYAAVANGGFRRRSLSDETRDDLAIRWAAFSLRRGPFVAEDSLEKFAEHLLDSGTVANEQDAIDVAMRLGNVVAAAWVYEGRGVEGAGRAAEDGVSPRTAVAMLVDELETLRAATDDALEALRKLESSIATGFDPPPSGPAS